MSTLDISTMSDLAAEDRDHMYMWFEKFVDIGFYFNATSVEYLERHIVDDIRPRIVKFNFDAQDFPSIAQAKTPGGLKTSAAAELEPLSGALLSTIPLLYGQCIAQSYGYKWLRNDDGDLVVIAAGDMKLNPFAKPMKFAAFGDEDSLVKYFKMASPEAIHSFISGTELVGEFVIANGISVDRYQSWFDDDGKLYKAAIFGKDGKQHVLLMSNKAQQNALASMTVQGGVQ